MKIKKILCDKYMCETIYVDVQIYQHYLMSDINEIESEFTVSELGVIDREGFRCLQKFQNDEIVFHGPEVVDIPFLQCKIQF